MSRFRRSELNAAFLMVAVAALVCLTALRAWAQGPVDGALHGTIVDGDGNAIAAASVRVRREDTRGERTIVADAQGGFLLAHMAPGRYTVLLSAVGFASSSVLTVDVRLGETEELRTRLFVAATGTAITVEAREGNDAVESGRTVGAGDLGLLPSPGRRWQDFALTADGVLPDQDADGLLSVHGLPSTQNNVLVDGVSSVQSFGSVPMGTGERSGAGCGRGTRTRRS